MQLFLDHLQNYKIAPVCIRCGCFFPNKFFFCSACFENQILKFENFEESASTTELLKVTSLFQWVPKTSDSLSLAIHLLKRPESKLAWSFLGKLFADFLRSNSRIQFDNSNSILVPVPGRKSHSVHTRYFSNELAIQLGVKKVDLLGHHNHNVLAQKHLSRRDRLNRDFKLCVDFTRVGEVEKMQNIVLIDDVVTTGATLQACAKHLRALYPKANLCAWVMFKRL